MVPAYAKVVEKRVRIAAGQDEDGPQGRLEQGGTVGRLKRRLQATQQVRVDVLQPRVQLVHVQHLRQKRTYISIIFSNSEDERVQN